jgi:hypothetical protein
VWQSGARILATKWHPLRPSGGHGPSPRSRIWPGNRDFFGGGMLLLSGCPGCPKSRGSSDSPAAAKSLARGTCTGTPRIGRILPLAVSDGESGHPIMPSTRSSGTGTPWHLPMAASAVLPSSAGPHALMHVPSVARGGCLPRRGSPGVYSGHYPNMKPMELSNGAS